MSYNPDEQLDQKEKSEFITNIIRYAGKLPDKANDTTKFNTEFDAHYQDQESRHVLKLYYKSSSDEQFFLLTRKAPSLYEKYVAVGGRLRVRNDSIVEYEEVFRTWRMAPDTLHNRGAFLFDLMVKGKPLDPYFTRNSNGVEYIEFPDEHVYYDKESRRWKSDQFGSIEDMIQQ
jgi:hypothetical protein